MAQFTCRLCSKEMYSYTEFVEHWGDIYCRECDPEKTNKWPSDVSLSPPRQPKKQAEFEEVYKRGSNTRTEAVDMREANLEICRATSTEGIVYLLKSGQNHKIGKTVDLDQRLTQLRIQLPDPTEVVHKIYTKNIHTLEAYWHRRFQGKRKNGEWFALDDNDVEEFMSVKNMEIEFSEVKLRRRPRGCRRRRSIVW
jgi:hypothetical protein